MQSKLMVFAALDEMMNRVSQKKGQNNVIDNFKEETGLYWNCAKE